MKSLEGRVAVVTGGAKGLGRAIADELAKEGAHIARLEVEMSTAKESAEEIGALGVDSCATLATCPILVPLTARSLNYLSTSAGSTSLSTTPGSAT